MTYNQLEIAKLMQGQIHPVRLDGEGAI